MWKVLWVGGAIACAGLAVAATRPAGEAPRRDAVRSWKTLTPAEERVIVHKGTEAPFSGAFADQHEAGVYRCKRCGAPLFPSDGKFDSRSGWPSFDRALPGAVREVRDADGQRTEIVCASCDAHLGHVFRGEGFTAADTRHCVNSVSLDFEPAAAPRGEAFFAGGCFWGVEHLMEQAPGVVLAESGYMGGRTSSPTYEEVCRGDSGHAEAVRVVFDPTRTSYEVLARLFFEIHDPTQRDRQGPDVGLQYRSAVFVADDEQRRVVRALIAELEARGYRVATRVEDAGAFWKAEAYHQDYYQRSGKAPYCHARVCRFGPPAAGDPPAKP